MFDKGEIVMSILTIKSTFEDIKTLLKNGDICFKKTIKKTFEEVSKDEEHDKDNVIESNEIQREFLDITGIAKTDKNEWSKCVVKFVIPKSKKKDKLDRKYDELLSKIHDISLENIYTKGIIDIECTKDGTERKRLFDKDNNWKFDFMEDGEIPERVDKGIRAIIDCLIKQFNKEYTIEKTPQYNLLLANKQLIMNGAPGTGKTYSARYIV